MLDELKKEMQALSNSKKKEIYQRFFKTGPGQYGEGDVFLGLSATEHKEIARKYNLDLIEIQELIGSEIHEYRNMALSMLKKLYLSSDDKNKQIIFEFYLKNSKKINNWDLVDSSAPNIVGNFLLNEKKAPKGVPQGGARTSSRPRDISKEMSTRGNVLYELARSDNLWEKRISIISCLAFIRNNEFDDALAISEILLGDSHDLIHKAVGWMLREVGKKNQEVLEDFLKKHYSDLPRTTLRYAIERFEEEKRLRFLKGEFK